MNASVGKMCDDKEKRVIGTPHGVMILYFVVDTGSALFLTQI